MLATSNTTNGLSQGHTSKVTAKDTKQLGTCINVCHFNTDGLSKAKSECIGRVMSDNKIDVLALQETHCNDDDLSAIGNIRYLDLNLWVLSGIGCMVLRLT